METTSISLKKQAIHRETLRIVHISDTHNKDYDHLIPPGDILIHSGDFTHRGKAEEIEKFRQFINRQPHRYKVVVCGNHEYGLDLIPRAQLLSLFGENVIMLHDSGVTIEGINFWGTSWNNSSQAWGVDQAIRADRWQLIPSDTDILITHIPPYGILDLAWDLSNTSNEVCAHCSKFHPKYNHWGDKALAERVYELKLPLHLFGHVHDEVGILKIGETTYSNAAMDIAKVVNVLKVNFIATPTPPTEDWNLSKILYQLETKQTFTSEPRQARVVLLGTGALNPIHNGHIKMMELARVSLQSRGYDVIGGFLSPSSDLYVSGKMKSIHQRLLRTSGLNKSPSLETMYSSSHHRVHMTRLACQDSEWLHVGCWESNQDYFADFNEVLSALEVFLWENNIFSHPDDTVMYVCGSDHFLKCSFMRKGVGTSRGYRPVVVVTRQEERDELLKKPIDRSKVRIITSVQSPPLSTEEELYHDLSSTGIRSLLYNSTSMSPEDATLRSLLPSPVYEYLISGEGRCLYREQADDCL